MAQDAKLNLYSSRHYKTDEALYSDFTNLTGIKINRIEAGEDALIERIRNEGERSPADVLVTVDAGRLWRAEQTGLLPAGKSTALEAASAACASRAAVVRLLTRARVIAYNKAKVKPAEVPTYESARRSEVERTHLHAPVHQHVQPVAAGRHDRPPRRGRKRKNGRRA